MAHPRVHHAGHHSPRIRCVLPSCACRTAAQGDSLESTKADAAGPAAGRSRDRPLARGNLAGDQKGAEAQDQTILFIDESGFYPLPSVVRTYAPVGHTPVLREWWTRDHLSAILALSPEGKLYFHSQDGALNSAAVVAFWEHLLREVSGRMVIIWDGAPFIGDISSRSSSRMGRRDAST